MEIGGADPEMQEWVHAGIGKKVLLTQDEEPCEGGALQKSMRTRRPSGPNYRPNHSRRWVEREEASRGEM